MTFRFRQRIELDAVLALGRHGVQFAGPSRPSAHLRLSAMDSNVAAKTKPSKVRSSTDGSVRSAALQDDASPPIRLDLSTDCEKVSIEITNEMLLRADEYEQHDV